MSLANLAILSGKYRFEGAYRFGRGGGRQVIELDELREIVHHDQIGAFLNKANVSANHLARSLRDYTGNHGLFFVNSPFSTFAALFNPLTFFFFVSFCEVPSCH